MNKVYLFLLLVFFTEIGTAQDFIPLVIDSSHNKFYILTNDGTFDTFEEYSVYSYNEEDSLAQIRSADVRFNYTYTSDTRVIIEEKLENTGLWVQDQRTTSTYIDDRLDSQLVEGFGTGEWSELTLDTYYYDALGNDTLSVRKIWIGGECIISNTLKQEFDVLGNITREEQYRYSPFSERLESIRGFEAVYDGNSNIISRTNLTGISGTLNFEESSLVTFSYNGAELQDTVQMCQYNDAGECLLSSIAIYDRSISGQYTINRFLLVGGELVQSSAQVYHPGPEVYGPEPDSLFSFGYENGVVSLTGSNQNYYTYEALGNDQIYYHFESYRFDDEFENDWYKDFEVERFYRLQTPTNTIDAKNLAKTVAVFPNPAKIGATLSVDFTFDEPSVLEVMVYDVAGRLVISANLDEGRSLPAPQKEGIFTILFIKNGLLIGLSKQVVTH